MFSLLNGVYQEYFSPQQLNVLIVGGQSDGKTAIMERIKVTDFSNTLSFPPSNDKKKRNRHQQRQQQSKTTSATDTNIPQPRRLLKSRFVFFSESSTATRTTQNQLQDNTNNENKKGLDNNSNEDDDDDIIDDIIDDDKAHQQQHNDDVDSCSDNDDYNGDVSGDEGYQHNNHDNSTRSPRRATRKYLRGRVATTNSNSSNNNNNKIKLDKMSSSTASSTAATTGNASTMTTNTTTTTSTNTGTNTNHTLLTGTTSSSLVAANRQRPWYSNFCPAPRKYKKHDDNDDDNLDYDSVVHDDTFDHIVDAEQNALLSTDIEMQHNDSFATTNSEDSMESIEFDHTMSKDYMDYDDTESNNTNDMQSSIPTHNNKSKQIMNDNMKMMTKRRSKKYKKYNVEDTNNNTLLNNTVPNKEYNIKYGAKMLPLEKIKRTIGMNLTKKLHICSAYVNIWDLGGKLVHLWERYYNDCDCIIFVWKIDTNDPDNKDAANKDDNNEDDDDRLPKLTPAQQFELLEQVRASVPDDIPFLILGHLFDPDVTNSTTSDPKQLKIQQQQQQNENNNNMTSTTTSATTNNNNGAIIKNRRYHKLLQYCRTDRLYSTSSLLSSNTHHEGGSSGTTSNNINNNNMTTSLSQQVLEGLYFVDASNGKGIKTAIEWLIRTAAVTAKQRGS